MVLGPDLKTLLHSESWLDFSEDHHNISRPDIIKTIPKLDEEDNLAVIRDLI